MSRKNSASLQILLNQGGPETSAHLENPYLSSKLLPNWMSLPFRAKCSGNSQLPQEQGDFF